MSAALPIILIGAGGHGRVLLDALNSIPRSALLGIVDPQLERGSRVAGVPVLGTDEALLAQFPPNEVHW